MIDLLAGLLILAIAEVPVLLAGAVLALLAAAFDAMGVL